MASGPRRCLWNLISGDKCLKKKSQKKTSYGIVWKIKFQTKKIKITQQKQKTKKKNLNQFKLGFQFEILFSPIVLHWNCNTICQELSIKFQFFDTFAGSSRKSTHNFANEVYVRVTKSEKDLVFLLVKRKRKKQVACTLGKHFLFFFFFFWWSIIKLYCLGGKLSTCSNFFYRLFYDPWPVLY